MASSSLTSKNRWIHDVFLSFRGPDTRNTFTGHLHHELCSVGIDVFIDTELQRGEVITSQLLRVIEESRISIVILSEKYASSSFCLDELEKILETKESKGQTVIPVFYHVDPTEVEEQRGTFGQEFAKLEAQLNKHLNSWKLVPSIATSFLRNVSLMWPTVDYLDEQRNNDEEATENIMKKMQKWRIALTQIAGLSGWHLKKGDHESNIIQDIVKKVSRKLSYTPLHVAEYTVGLTSRVEYIIEKLNKEIQDVCMLGLHGMGGVGKTTIAKALYNTYASQFEFEGICFLSKVREKSRNIIELQQTLLSKLLGYQGHSIIASEEGIELIKRKLQNKKVLIVIDDVDHREQLEQLVGRLEWFGGGSIIIITTRNLHLLEQNGVTMIHEIKELKLNESLQLFSWYAFKEPQPDKAHMELSKLVIGYTGGLPLALVVLGSSLYKRSAPQWADMLKKLKRCPNKEINDVLKVSYDSLEDEEKTIFLDIAFFFRGKDKHKVTKFLDVCGFGAHLGIEILIQNSLVYIDWRGKLEMHDLLGTMGTKIALTEYSRLCIRETKDIRHLFIKNKRAYDVEILVLDLYGEEEAPLNWLENLTNLRALAIRNGRFIKMPKKLPNSIRWLEWHNNCSTTIPSGFLPHNLLAIEMFCSNIKKFNMPKAKNFMNLTFVNLSGSKHLIELVDISSIPNIEELNLKGCEKLKKIHNSIGSLEQLKILNLEGCCSLTSLPNLVKNKCLFYLYLRNCSKLENLPNLPTTLLQLWLENSGIKEIPFFIGNLNNLWIIDASNCKNLTSVSNSIYKLSPKIIYIKDCPKLLQLPEAESSMLSSNPTSTEIVLLDWSGNKFVCLPINIFKFIHIRNLYLDNCKWLVEIPELPPTLWFLIARNCKSLLRFSQFQFHNTFYGDFSECHEIVGENEKKSWREMVEKGWRTERKKDYHYEVILPGNEIPEWFSYAFNCHGSVHSFKLPSSIFNANLIGIACSAIFQDPTSTQYTSRCAIGFSFKAFVYNTTSLSSPLVSVPHVRLGFLSYNTIFYINAYVDGLTSLSSPLVSEPHMWLGFKYFDFDLPKLWEAREILCEFYINKKEVELKRVGVHFIYKN